MVLTLDKVLKHINSLYLENISNTNNDIPQIEDVITEKIPEPPSYFSGLDVSLDLVNRNLLESVILCLDIKYLELDNKERKNYIQIVKEREKEQYEIIYKDKKYRKFGFTKKNLLESIKEGTDSKLHILYISDFFNLNIFIIDIDQINVYYSEELFNKFKSSLILFKKEDNLYTHIKTNSKTVFTYHDNAIKHLLKKENWDNLKPVHFKKEKVFDIGVESLDTYLKNYCIINPEDLEEDNNKTEKSNDEKSNDEENQSKKIEKVKKIKKHIKKELKDNSEDRLEVIASKEVDDETELDDDIELEENAFDEETLEEDSEEENDEEDDDNLENTNGVFMKRITKSDNLDIKVSTRMKKDQLLTLAKELKIETKNGKKEKTKKELCDEINSKI